MNMYVYVHVYARTDIKYICMYMYLYVCLWAYKNVYVFVCHDIPFYKKSRLRKKMNKDIHVDCMNDL